ncbi:beta-lactamase [Catenulispora acidiphila DSM 44928]|uniref:Beta-lactamase n=1 Tax=Catenulispora acidiphila (strain DSM 44928 / JCM 14897 / NBRC 102108 / NRRL B-24433 / ID139908) TaxID=479433 RepID=C7Q275_CATAD|nr:serine hydrolase domain-containing protein [Catenulispora acidiphila]ACU77612.1 beta-lactamase [Catenulispora acidiphila DSM 44928]
MDITAAGMVVGVSRSGRRTFEIDGPIQADRASVFRIASLTKPLTAVATVRAFAQRGIPLTTPAIELLPSLAGDWRADQAITVEQLLAQVSGLRESVEGSTVAALGQGPDVLAEAARLVVQAGNERTPGERWSYYNGNYFLVGHLLATVTESTFEQALDTTLLTPWELRRTGFETPASPVTGWDEQTPLAVEDYPRGRRPSGGLWSSADDYLSFAEKLLADPVLLEEIRRPRTRPEDPMSYGLAWALGPSGQMYLNGRLDGFRTAVLLAPEHQYASVALGNQAQLLPQIGKRLSALQHDLTGDDLAVELDAFAA